MRAAVIRHAADLFAERGPTATSVRDIADRAAADAAALLVSWELLGSFLRAATRLQDVPEAELRRDVGARATRILDNPGC
ncbi:TetR family transcriptional regulator [Nocardia asteroides]|uniref:TetR family transcriptional regulator n=1 Tax=Nocardia asteroides TaxID=1824 RepID=UPI003F57FFD9